MNAVIRTENLVKRFGELSDVGKMLGAGQIVKKE